MANQLLITPNRALDANAYASPAATATFYASGTSTLITVYSDEAGSIVASNPITADANGIFPQTYALVNAKVIVRDSGGATLWTIDPVPTTSTTAVGASKISFSPTVDIPETNVQDAIEAAAAFAASGFTDYGLGNSGNAPILSALNDAGTATGMYRFTGSTTGTFPTGVVAADTGLVTVDRQTSSEAMMTLRAAGSDRVFVRMLAASSWQAWREVPNTLASATGTARRFLRMNSSNTGQEYAATINLETAVAGSGQTSIDFTGIPTAARRITILMTGISTNGTAPVRVILGDAGGFETSGYIGATTSINSATPATTNPTASFEINFGAGDTAGAARSGKITLDRLTDTGFAWVANGIVGLSNTNAIAIVAARMILTEELDRVRLGAGGTDTFDAGTVNISWEI
jgi:hypothetical protein